MITVKNQTLYLIAVLCLLALLSVSGVAMAQQAVGVVTALKGKAQLTRAAAETPLRFKDNLILRDVIDTQENSLTRVLFGGKSTVTVRELSSLEVREELLPGGGTRTIHDLSSGSILVNVARSLMGRGDEVQIRTPNAVAAVRGSVVFALYNAVLAQSVFAVLAGSAVVTPEGQPPLTLTPNTSVDVTGSSATGVQATEGTITQGEANEIVAGSEVGLESADTIESADAGVQEAAQLSVAVVVAAESTVVDTTAPDSAPQVKDESKTDAPIIAGGGGEKITEEASVFPFTFAENTTSSKTPFLKITNDTVNVSGDLIKVNTGVNVNLTGQLLAVDPSSVTTNEDLLFLTNASLITGGSLLTSVNSAISATSGAVLALSSKSTVENTAGPVIKVTGGSLTADSLIDTDESGNTFKFTGTILDLKDTTVTFRTIEDESPMSPDNDNFTLTLAANEPILRLDNSTLKITGTTNDESLFELFGGDFTGGTFPGVVLIATNSSTVTNQGGGLLEMDGVLTTTTTNPLVQITNSTVNSSSSTASELFIVEGPPSGSTNITMSGPLASIASTVTVDQDFFLIDTGAKLTSNTTDPFIKATDATLTVGSGDTEDHFFEVESSGAPAPSGAQFTTTNTGTGPLVQFSNTKLKQGGTNLVLFKATGTGTNFQPIKGSSSAEFTFTSSDGGQETASFPIGALFKATNASDISVDTAIKIDNALFEATLPVVELVSTSSTQTQITSDGTFADIGSTNSSKLVLKGPVFSLDKGLITVTNGPLVSVKKGSTVDILGTVFKLINGSKINVVNGPAILVDGTGGFTPAFNATGALLDFGNTSGNTFIVNNGLAFTTENGINISEGTLGSITIGLGQIINNPGENTVTQNGAVIQTIGGGTVNIDGTGGQ